MKLFGRKDQNQPKLTIPLGYTNDGKLFAFTGTDAEKHVWLQGVSGSGKSWALCWIILTLLRNNRNCIVIDPHGDLAELLLKYLAYSGFYDNEKAYEKLWYIECRKAKTEAAIAYNILRQPYTPYDISANFMSAVHRAFPSSSGATTALDNLLLAASLLLSLNEEPITKLYDLVFSDTYRNTLLKNCENEQIQAFFAYKFPGNKVNSQVVDSTLRRLFLLSFSPVLKNMLSQKENTLDFRTLMQRQVSLIFNLGGLSEEDKKLLGCLLTVHIEQAFMSRADIPEQERHFYSVLIDEFPVFAEQSGEAFNTIMEQVRKYKGSLLLINQHLEQLPRGIAGALQNAIPIMMKTGYRDSSTITSFFYRKDETDARGFLSQFLNPKEPDAFSEIEKIEQARKHYETLPRSEAFVTLHGQTYHIQFPTLPAVSLPDGLIEQIKQEYTRRLLTPITALPSSAAGADVLSESHAIAKWRVSASSPVTPFQTYVGASGSDAEIQALVTLYGYVTVAQVASLLGKSETAARTKLKKLVDAGLLTVSSVPKVTPSGKTPLVYSVKSKKLLKSQLFLDHALATSSILINTVSLPACATVDLKSDHALKAAPIQVANGLLVPDGYVKLHYKGFAYCLYFEIDRNTELQKEKIISKLNSYKALASQCECMAACFCVVEGGDLRVKTLRTWAQEVIPSALQELFLFASIDLTTLTPETLLLSPLWLAVDDTTPQPLLET